MRTTFLFHTIFWCLLLGLTFTTVAQEALQVSIPHQKIQTSLMNPDAECTGAGELIYDDGTFENGYGWNPSIGNDGRFLMLATPLVYPWQFNTFCVVLTRNGTSDAFTFDIIVYDNSGTGGIPGNIVSTIPGVTATGVPTWPVLEFYDFDISSVPALASGSYYLGIKYDAAVQLGFFIGSDESTSTPLWPSYASSDGGATWNANESLWAGYRAMGIRSLGSSGPPCPIDPPTNPSPVNGAVDVPISGNTATWTNGLGTEMTEVYFGEVGSLVMVYDGTPIESFSLAPVEPLSYDTEYGWLIVGKNDTCNVSGPTWTFTTIADPSIQITTVYPMSVAMWTGTTEGATKTDGEINTVFPNVGWAAYDVSAILPGAVVLNLQFYGYVNATNWPWWSATPMGAVNPISATGAEISAQIQANRDEPVAYIYSNEASSFAPGWVDHPLVNTAITDFENSLTQGWFAMGFVDRDDLATYFLNFDGWSQTNPPYIEVTFVPVPVELTSFTATASEGLVELSWITATETNNSGFEVQRNNGSDFETIAFIEGHGTTTETQAYSYSDREVNVGSYSYRLKQVDFDGTFEYSNVIEADVPAPATFALDQNYPNPFNPSTKIAFQLAVDSKVSLKIFDVLGQEVATLVNTNLVAGSHNVNFNASAFNSGVYLYRIEATGIDGANFIDVKKMILTK